MKKIISVLLTITICSTLLTGCKEDQPAVDSRNITATETVSSANASDILSGVEDAEFNTPTPMPTIDPMILQQTNSINMLNYIVSVSQRISSSDNSRLFLEQVYSELYNNTNPEMDLRSKDEIRYLFNIIESFRMTAVKRERLQYIYEQNKAQAMRDAVPNPLGLLSAVGSFDIKRIIASVAYMAVDSITSYQSSKSTAELQFLQDGWALDDQESADLNALRSSTFNYMVETVQEYKLSGAVALSSDAVTEYVNWKKEDNLISQIQFFESAIDTYKTFGPYWLTLAELYYKNNDYEKCLEAVTQYEKLNNTIFRYDTDYAAVLPFAIASAEEIYSGKQYETEVARYAAAIIENRDIKKPDGWELRYIAAQAYIKLYAETKNNEYLNKAYDIILNNVNVLVAKQQPLNDNYTADISTLKQTVPSDVTKEEKKEIKHYNELIETERKTALPPVYEPLLLNCELLFALADKLSLPQNEQDKIYKILHNNNAPLYLCNALDAQFDYNKDGTIDTDSYDIIFKGDELLLPVALLTDDYKVTVTVKNGNGKDVFTDWNVKNVTRKDQKDISTYTATLTSKTAKEYKFSEGNRISIEILPAQTTANTAATVNFTAISGKLFGVDFERVEK